ncbi:MAG: hypothetical protein KDD45_00455 [Bdellovibrionales bacterium]|nr:hypothetical protein [Bdellovibrionales bacterium]
MSNAAIFVLLLPAIGYICLHKQNKIKKKTKPISGLELTYHSAIYGTIWLAISYVIIQTILFYWKIDFSDKALPYLFSGIPSNLYYFLPAPMLSLLWAHFFINPDNNEWHGDSNAGRIWGELLAKETIVVLFLKNGKCYQGLLTEVEVSERIPLEDRIVSVLVLFSGYRSPKGTVDWNTKYQSPLKHHFYMSEIVNFSEYAPGATFKIVNTKKTKTS